eukprot:330703_1
MAESAAFNIGGLLSSVANSVGVVGCKNEIAELKLKGNRCYGEQNYFEAIKYYTEGLHHRMCEIPKILETRIEFVELVDLRQALLINRGRSYWNINEPEHRSEE